MALQLEGVDNVIFSHSEDFDTGVGKVRPGSNSIVVAQDGSGDTDDIVEGVKLLSTKPGTVFIKQGTYTIDSAVTISYANQHILGDGWGTIIKTSGNIRAFYIVGSTCSVRDLKIIGSRTAGSSQDGILVTGSTFFAENLRIETCGANGIYIASATRGIIQNCEIYDCATNSIFVSNASKTIIANCHLYNSDQIGIKMTGAAGYHVIEGNVIADHANDGIYMDDQFESVISGNTMEGNGNANTEDGIHIIENCSQIAITGNHVTGSAGYGISIDNSGVDTPDRILIVGNSVYGNTTGQLDLNGTNMQIGHNLTE